MNKHVTMDNIFRELISKCNCCGKMFPHTEYHGYWYGDLICCSYHCMRKLRAEDLERRRRKLEEDAEALSGRPGPLKEEERAEILRLTDRGVTVVDIAKRVERSPECVRRCIRDSGRIPNQRRNDRASKVPAAMVLEMRRMRKRGMTYKEISDETGYGITTIFTHCTGIPR